MDAIISFVLSIDNLHIWILVLFFLSFPVGMARRAY
jgi:hypothetical protein